MGKTALIVVDVQRDFCEGGALQAEDTLSLMQPLKGCIDASRRAGAVIVYTQDWHPANHSSFKKNGGRWPVHCVAGSRGAELMEPLKPEPSDVILRKGEPVDGEGFSGFDGTELRKTLRSLDVERVFVAGIATEYCVRTTAMDALREGFKVFVLADMVRSVDASQTSKVLAEMAAAGVKSATCADVRT